MQTVLPRVSLVRLAAGLVAASAGLPVAGRNADRASAAPVPQMQRDCGPLVVPRNDAPLAKPHTRESLDKRLRQLPRMKAVSSRPGHSHALRERLHKLKSVDVSQMGTSWSCRRRPGCLRVVYRWHGAAPPSGSPSVATSSICGDPAEW